MKLKEFLNRIKEDKDYIYFPYNITDTEINIARKRSYHSLLIDIWKKVDVAVKLYKKDKTDIQSIQDAMNRVHNMCALLYIAYESPEYDGLKYECKIEEYILTDFLLGENYCCLNENTASKWFAQFYYDINYDVWR